MALKSELGPVDFRVTRVETLGDFVVRRERDCLREAGAERIFGREAVPGADEGAGEPSSSALGEVAFWEVPKSLGSFCS